ncbi:MAG: hypothetical protein PHD67_08120 [Oscillospiraceae bacterium]|nr:hypothetical protein [Oscillospiraceae bacterium]
MQLSDYTLGQWVFFFYFYCFVGWCIESTIVSIDQKRWVNRGFLRSPLLPLYGSGAIVILFASQLVQRHPVAVFFAGMAAATILEYFVGWGMESLFQIKYWDYSSKKFNLHGRICLMSSLFWGFLSLVMTFLIHPPVERLMLRADPALIHYFDAVVTVVFVLDTIYSVRGALDLNRLLANITRIRTELSRITALLEERREMLQSEREEHSHKLEALREELESAFQKVGYFKSSLLKAFPHAHSKQYRAALKDLRARLLEKIEKKDERRHNSVQ